MICRTIFSLLGLNLQFENIDSLCMDYLLWFVEVDCSLVGDR